MDQEFKAVLGSCNSQGLLEKKNRMDAYHKGGAVRLADLMQAGLVNSGSPHTGKAEEPVAS